MRRAVPVKYRHLAPSFAAVVLISPFAVALVGCCGGGLSDADQKAVTAAARANATLEGLCQPEVVDAGSCSPSQVRALERLSYCASASVLSRHGQGVPDAGIQCLAQ